MKRGFITNRLRSGKKSLDVPIKKKIETIEGNAWGELGDGNYGQGVITRTRNLDGVAHVYRFLGSDFDE